MENTREFEVTLRVGECSERETSDVFARAQTGREALETFAQVLRAYGMDVSAEYTASGKQAKLTVCHPEAHEAEGVRNRNPNGRPRKPRVYGVTLDWLEGHSVEEGMKALGDVSRRTYYRRLAELREKAHE